MTTLEAEVGQVAEGPAAVAMPGELVAWGTELPQIGGPLATQSRAVVRWSRETIAT